MIIVDTHCHVSPYWYEPLEALLFHMDRSGVEKATLVQYMGQYNNDYQADCVRRYPGRLASAVLVDWTKPDALATLENLAGQGAAGLRLRAPSRSPGDDPLAIWRKAEQLSLPVTCGGTAALFADDAFAGLIQAVPNLPIIIEHLGSVNKPGGEAAPFEIRNKVFALSRFPNTYIKIHGLGEFSPRNETITEPFPFEGRVPPLLDLAYEAFGPERMLWGSDYPPVSAREGYYNSLHYTLDYFKDKPAAERELIFGGTALKLYRFD
jgi:L-fuconolactonase